MRKHLVGALIHGMLAVMAFGQSFTYKVSDALERPVTESGAPAGSYSLSDFEHIKLFNGSLSFSLPLVEVGGRGEARYTMTLHIENRWEINTVYISPGASSHEVKRFVATEAAGYGPGRLSVRSIEEMQWCGTESKTKKEYTYYSFSLPDGSDMTFYPKPESATSPERGDVAVYDCTVLPTAKMRNRGSVSVWTGWTGERG